MSVLQYTARRIANANGRESRLIRRLRPAYESLLNWSSYGKGIPWPINGITYRIDAHYRHQLGSEYDAPVAAFLRARVKPGDLCLDIGANVGVYVLQFAHWTAPSGRVIAFEPNPSARRVLEKHIRLNKLTERTEVVATAVGASSGEAILYAAGTDGMSRLGAPNRAIAANTQSMTVPIITLDSYCESQGVRPDWVLIDIEGFEIAALRGAQRLIKDRTSPLGFIVEMHPDIWDSADTTRAGAEELLVELGLRAVPLTGQRDPLDEHGLVHLAFESDLGRRPFRQSLTGTRARP